MNRSNLRQRTVEAVALTAFAVLWTLVAARAWEHLRDRMWTVLAAAPLAWLAADFMGGLVHFMADNFGHPATPWFGPTFIKPFREHHADPAGITRHGFLERHGNNAFVTVPVLALAAAYPSGAFADAFVCVLTFGVALTNQVHSWAHMDRPPAWIRPLQSIRLILSRSHHEDHHTPPYKSNYCILTGWMEPVLRLCVRTLFGKRAETLLAAGR